MESAKKLVLVAVDPPDPDNLAAVLATVRFAAKAGRTVCVLLTGRPVGFEPGPTWKYRRKTSEHAQIVSAGRFRNFLKACGIVSDVRIYDGGIAPRTIIPHDVHFPDYFKFGDVDPLQALETAPLRSQDELIRLLVDADPFAVAVGGPMTGLRALLERCPALAAKITEIHAMFAMWGSGPSKAMQFEGMARGTGVQFNAACDPAAAHFVLTRLTCQIFLVPTEVTKTRAIGFWDAEALREALPDTPAGREFARLSQLWYDTAIKERQAKELAKLMAAEVARAKAADPGRTEAEILQDVDKERLREQVLERMYIHDAAAVLSLDPETRARIFTFVPIRIAHVAHLPTEAEENLGRVVMEQVDAEASGPGGPRYAATGFAPGGIEAYLHALAETFDGP